MKVKNIMARLFEYDRDDFVQICFRDSKGEFVHMTVDNIHSYEWTPAEGTQKIVVLMSNEIVGNLPQIIFEKNDVVFKIFEGSKYLNEKRDKT